MVETLKKSWRQPNKPWNNSRCKCKDRAEVSRSHVPTTKATQSHEYLKRHKDLDKDLMYLQRILENKIAPESDDCRLLHLIESSQRGVFSPQLLNTASMSPIQPAAYSKPPANVSAPERVPVQVHAGSLGKSGSKSSVIYSRSSRSIKRPKNVDTINFRFHPYH